jgi:hypothetical protein
LAKKTIDINSVLSREHLPDSIRNLLNNANIFYSESYMRYLCRNYGTPVYLYSNNFVLLVNLHKKFIFRYANFPVEYLALNDQNSESATLFLDACIYYLKNKFSIQWINVTSASALFSAYPTYSKRIPFGSHIIDLFEPEESIWLKVHSKHKNSIRKAEKSEVKIRFGGKELIDDYLSLDVQTWKRSGKTGTSKKIFSDLLHSLDHNTLICIAYKENLPQGGAFYLFNNAMSYYLFGATKDQPESGSMNLLHWKTILYMKGLGVQKYSFVGCRINEDKNSKYHEIQRFKERFGGFLFSGYMFKVIINKPFHLLFSTIIKIKSGKPYSDAIDQEIHKWVELNK